MLMSQAANSILPLVASKIIPATTLLDGAPMFCQACGKQLPGDISICPACGRFRREKTTDIVGEESRKTWTFAEMVKFREDIATDLSLPEHSNEVRQMLERVYDALSAQLKEAARRTGQEEEFRRADVKWEEYRSEFLTPSSLIRAFVEAKSPEEINAIAMRDDGASLKQFAQKYAVYGVDAQIIDDYIKIARLRDGMDAETLIAAKEVDLREQAERLELQSTKSPIPKRWWLKSKAWLIRIPRIRRWLAQPSERDRREWKMK
jgi:hypothetical protein